MDRSINNALQRFRGARTLGGKPALARRRGVTSVEFALTLPILFLMLFGMVELTRLSNVGGIARNAAFIGARQTTIQSSTASDVTNRVAEYLNKLGVHEHTITIDPPVLDGTVLEATVTVEVPLNANNGFGMTQYVSGKSATVSVTRSRDAN